MPAGSSREPGHDECPKPEITEHETASFTAMRCCNPSPYTPYGSGSAPSLAKKSIRFICSAISGSRHPSRKGYSGMGYFPNIHDLRPVTAKAMVQGLVTTIRADTIVPDSPLRSVSTPTPWNSGQGQGWQESPLSVDLNDSIATTQYPTRGPCHDSGLGSARAIASMAVHQPSQAFRPGRRRKMFSTPLHFA
jgi:hypothetical protein